jgi:hypothetical protein
MGLRRNSPSAGHGRARVTHGHRQQRCPAVGAPQSTQRDPLDGALWVLACPPASTALCTRHLQHKHRHMPPRTAGVGALPERYVREHVQPDEESLDPLWSSATLGRSANLPDSNILATGTVKHLRAVLRVAHWKLCRIVRDGHSTATRAHRSVRTGYVLIVIYPH